MIEVERLQLTVGDRSGSGRSFSLREVTFSVASGEYFVLLGKSGSGKTLLLETICGLNQVAGGRIHIAGDDVTDLEPRRRGIGYLPQDYALFPHRSVYRNVTYGLFGRGLDYQQRSRKTAALLDELGIAHLAARYPARLSGGEKQRVALARALVVEPRVLLLDEPVSAVDEQTRDSLCRRLKLFQQRHRTTTLHVCHNFAEMLQVADRVAVVDNGQVIQTGTPQQILQRPINVAVAKLAQPGNLFIDGVWLDSRSDGLWLHLAKGVELATASGHGVGPQDGVAVMIREENIRLVPELPDRRDSRTTFLPGTVIQVDDMGPLVRLTLSCNDQLRFLVTQSKNEYKHLTFPMGGQAFLAIDPDDVHVVPRPR